MKIVYNVNVWGKKFIDFFNNICLASQLVGNNLDFLSIKLEIIFLICTKKNDIDYLKKSKFFQQLYKIGAVKIIPIDSFFFGEKFTLQTICYQLAAQEGLRLDCPVIYMCPDMLCSHNFLKMLYEAVQKGKRAFLFYAFRLNKPKILKRISERPHFCEEGISVQDLVNMAFENLNAQTSMYLSQEYKTCFSDPMIWKLGENVHLLKAIGGHPFLIWPDQRVLPQTAVDEHYLYHSVSSWSLVEVCANTNQAAIFEISDDFDLPKKKLPFTAFNFSQWAKKMADPYRIKILFHDYYYNSQPLNQKKYAMQLKKFKRFEKKVRRFYNKSVSYKPFAKRKVVIHFLRNVVGHILPQKIKLLLKKLFQKKFMYN